MSLLKWVLREIGDVVLVIAFLLVVGFLADPDILGAKTWVLLLVGCAVAVLVVVIKIVRFRRLSAKPPKAPGQE